MEQKWNKSGTNIEYQINYQHYHFLNYQSISAIKCYVIIDTQGKYNYHTCMISLEQNLEQNFFKLYPLIVR